MKIVKISLYFSLCIFFLGGCLEKSDTKTSLYVSTSDFDMVFKEAWYCARTMPLWTLTDMQKKDGVLKAVTRDNRAIEIYIQATDPGKVKIQTYCRDLSLCGEYLHKLSTFLSLHQK